MPVIAMTREMGSGGREVAQRVADKLGLELVLHEMVEQALAERLEVPESTIHRRFEGGAGWRERWRVGDRRLARHTADEILALADKGNVVIRGWGACLLLRGIPHVVRVRICAPLELRARRVVERRGFGDAGAARREIERNDDAHRRTVKAAFGVEREDSLLYDLVLNTERTSTDSCTHLICDLVASPDFAETGASRAILADTALEAHVRLRLAERFTSATGVSGIEAAARDGKVVLKGIAIHSSLAEEAARIAGAVPGVKDVDNRIEIARGPRGL
jgi:cytidylate kinase